MKRPLLFFLTFLLIFQTSTSQVLNSAIVLPAQNASILSINQNRIAVDLSENLYLVAPYGTNEYDLDPGAAYVPSHPGSTGGYYIAKYSSTGNLLWNKSCVEIGFPSAPKIFAVETDNSGNLYFTGECTGTIDFDPGPGQTLINGASNFPNGFVVSYDPSGNLRFAWEFDGQGEVKINALYIYPNGDVLLGGEILTDSVDLDPTAGTFPWGMLNIEDAFIGTYSSTGVPLDIKILDGGVAATCKVTKVGAVPSGGIWAYGSFHGSVDFDQQAGQQLIGSSGFNDGFLVEYDGSGNLNWVKQLSGYFTPVENGAALAANGNYLLCGMAQSTVDFDPGIGVALANSPSTLGIYDSNGNFINKVDLGSNVNRFGYDPTKDMIWVMGTLSVSNSFDINPESPVEMVSIPGGGTCWVATLNGSGGFIDGWFFPGIGANDPGLSSQHAHISPNGKFYMSGIYHYPTDLDPGPTVISYPTQPPAYYIYVSNYGGDVVTVEGNIYLDMNSNGAHDGMDLPCMYCPIFDSVGASTFHFLTDANGDYSLRLDTGSYTLSAQLTYFNPVPSERHISLQTFNTTLSNHDFALQPTGSITDFGASLSSRGLGRPGRYTSVTFACRNNGTTSENSDMIVHHDTLMQYILADVPPDSIAPGYLKWNAGVLNPTEVFSSFVRFRASPTTSPSLTPPLPITMASNPHSPDFAPGDNADSVDIIISSSYDPNSIHLVPSCFATPSTLEDPIHFLIEFQNTGNDTAFEITILDTLHTMLDLTTLSFQGSSHPVTRFELLPNRVLRFYFENILLPDSTENEPGSHGMVTFDCKAYSGMNLGDMITSQAHIYFDFNAPVATNVGSVTVEQFSASSTPSANGNGTISVIAASGNSYFYSLDNGTFQSNGSFTNVDGGDHLIEISNGAACIYEMILHVDEVANNDVAFSNSITLFPNPSTGEFTVTSSLFDIESIEVTDLEGRIIHHQLFEGKTRSTNFTISVKGIYFAGVTVSGKPCWKKIVVK